MLSFSTSRLKHWNLKYISKWYFVISVGRSASNYRRPQLDSDEVSKQLDVFKVNYFKDHTTALTKTEWQKARQELIGGWKHINENNVDATILGMCQDGKYLPLAKSYVVFLRDSGLEPNSASLGRLLRVYNAAYHARGGQQSALLESEQAEVLAICATLRSRHDVLDATTCENLIHGLVTTKQWTAAQDILKINQIISTPSVQSYSEVAKKAFTMSQLEIGWQLLEEMLEKRKQPKCEVFTTYLKKVSDTLSPKEFLLAFERLLILWERHEILITENIANCIRDEVVPKQSGVLAVVPSKLSHLGQCSACGQHMQNISISGQDFDRLSESFLHKVVTQRDVFQKSTPEELERFKRFVSKTAPYDCVIDGLNVAYSTGSKKPPSVLANLLAAVVKHFNAQRKHVLVLGRKHMTSWPKKPMQYVAQHANVFFANNLSHDDPFLLYATLKSGPSADFFSRDLMRSHAHLLGADLKLIFRRWQQEHQYSLVTQTQDGKIIVKEPIRHCIYANKVNNIWHLPCKLTYSSNPSETLKVADNWLCVKLQQMRQK